MTQLRNLTCRLLASSRFAFALLALLFLARGAQLHSRGLFETRTVVDSQGYLDAAAEPFSLAKTLSDHRTPVYPFFLRSMHVFNDSLTHVPYLHYTAFGVSLSLLFLCLHRSGLAAWQALAATAPLLGCTVLAEHVSTVQPEVLATAFGLVCLGMTFLISARGITRNRALLLALLTALTYLTRPAFLFVVAVCPFAVMMVSSQARNRLTRAALLKETLLATFACLLPLLCYASLRLLVVGHFGVVSFGGVNIAGFALNPDLCTRAEVQGLQDAELRKLGEAILRRRDQIRESAEYAHLPPYSLDEKLIREMPQAEAWTGSYNAAIWDVAVPAVAEELGVSPEHTGNPDWVVINQKLNRLSQTILKRHNDRYLTWLTSAADTGLRNTFRYETAGRLVTGGIVALLLAAVFIRGCWHCISGSAVGRLHLFLSATIAGVLSRSVVLNVVKQLTFVFKGSILPVLIPFFAVATSLTTCLSCFFSVVILNRESPAQGQPVFAWTALCALYFAAGLLLVILVEPPMKRYLIAISPAVAGAVLLVALSTTARFFGLTSVPNE